MGKVAGVAVAAFVFYVHAKRDRIVCKKGRPLGGPNLLLGFYYQMKLFFTGLDQMSFEIRKYGPIHRHWFVVFPVVVIGQPDLVREALVTVWEFFGRPSDMLRTNALLYDLCKGSLFEEPDLGH